jgi:glycosyltransferase involved in cell wall biosynthesis
MLDALASVLPPPSRLSVLYNAPPRAPKLFDDRIDEHCMRVQTATLWHQCGVPLLLRRFPCDVYLGTGGVIPAFARVPRVAVIHDCLAFHDRDAKPGAEGRYWRRWTRAAARQATCLVAVSQSTAADCERWLGADRTRITVIPNGVSSSFRPASDAERAAGLDGLPGDLRLAQPYVLQIGAYDAHKGGRTAAEAIAILRAQGRAVSLVRCGPGDPGPRHPAVVEAGFVDDATLQTLLRCAAAVIVAAAHEGFGLPVLEAMASGTPVVASRAGALTEAGGDVALYARPNDAADFAAALARLLDDPGEAAARRHAGLDRARAFTWESSARLLLDVLDEATRRGARASG